MSMAAIMRNMHGSRTSTPQRNVWSNFIRLQQTSAPSMEDWIQTRPSILLKDRDSVDPSRVHLLNLTLNPTRPWTSLRPDPLDLFHKHTHNDSSKPLKTMGHSHPIAIPSSTLSKPGFALPPAWHLILFPPRNLESEISRDGYDVGPMSPPSPYVHRKWASGEFVWSSKETVRVGDVVDQTATVEKVERKMKRGEGKGDMIFVWQKREIRVLKGDDEGVSPPAIVEKRCHVFTTASSPSNATRMVPEPHPTFDAELRPPIPSMVTLFRYSALTFNAHKIHLDHDFATKVEGQPGPLVHGPLTATYLADLAARVIALASSPLTDLKLDTDALEALDPFFLLENVNGRRVRRFEYRATAPLVVGREVVVRAKVIGDGEVDVWAVDGSTGNVVMVGRAEAE